MSRFKLITILLGIVIMNIIVFSPSLLGLSMNSSSALIKSLAITVLIVSAIVVIYASYKYLFGTKEQEKILIREAEEAEDSSELAQMLRFRNHPLYPVEVEIAIDQVNRMKEKKEALLEILRQRFQENELSYGRFLAVITSVEQLFHNNVQGLINKLHGSQISNLDQLYSHQSRQMFSAKVLLQKQELHKEYTTYVQGYISSNEEILTKLDKLVLETSLLNSNDFRLLDEMPCMKEINELIEQTKYYK